jgi:protein-S-isoprenylcysteine O-methyltransferase Ste14
MSRRWMRWLLMLYPKSWRERYGREVLNLTDELIRAGDVTPRRAGLDLVAVAIGERGRALWARIRVLNLAIRNLVFTIVVPGLGGVWVPWRLLASGGRAATPVAWEAIPVIAAGAALYLYCVGNFAAVGRGTPGPWDAPTRVVAAGPYRWVAYAGMMAVLFHLFVTGYEERTLSRRFGPSYLAYRRTVPRWVPARPQSGQEG